ncbi:MAG TPA: hypothetical protein VMC85_05855 [Desulfomonilaceae bacterium]|nr:hypothetical protein [Desulfomonilaceae bacterium]
MKGVRACFLCVLCLAVILVTGVAMASQGKVPGGYRDIKLGMSKTEVLDLLQKGPIHFSFDDSGREIGEIVRGDDLFRFATYRFDDRGVLVEIALEMREILGRDQVLDLYNKQLGLNLSPRKATVDSNLSIEVRDNVVIMKMEPTSDTRSARAKESKP